MLERSWSPAQRPSAGEAFADPGRDPGERQANQIGSRIGAELAGTGAIGAGPLPPDVRAVAESHLGVNLEGARLHSDERAHARAREVAAFAVTEGTTISFAKGRLSVGSSEGRALLGHELTHVAQQVSHGEQGRPMQRKEEPSTYQRLKESAYSKTISTVAALRTRYFKALHSAADLLPQAARGPAHTLVDLMNDVAQIAHNFLFYVVGVIVGLGEGAVGMITGLVQLGVTILRYLKEIAEAILGSPANLQEHWGETKELLQNLGPGLKKILDDWLTKFEGETQERQSAMIGELIGEVVFFFATFEVSAAKLGSMGKVALPLPALEPAQQLAAVGANVGTKLAGGTEAITINMAKVGPQAAAAGTVGAEAQRVADKANEAQKGQTPPESKPDTTAPKKAEAGSGKVDVLEGVSFTGVDKQTQDIWRSLTAKAEKPSPRGTTGGYRSSSAKSGNREVTIVEGPVQAKIPPSESMAKYGPTLEGEHATHAVGMQLGENLPEGLTSAVGRFNTSDMKKVENAIRKTADVAAKEGAVVETQTVLRIEHVTRGGEEIPVLVGIERKAWVVVRGSDNTFTFATFKAYLDPGTRQVVVEVADVIRPPR